MRTALWLVAAQAFGPAAALAAVEPEPVLTILRPTAADPTLQFVAEKSHPRSRIFFPHAAVSVRAEPGKERRLTADLLGVARLPPAELLAGLPASARSIVVSATVALGGKTASRGITLSPEELRLYIREAADRRVNEGNSAAGEGRLEDATREYAAALELDPSNARAAHNLALAHEKRKNRYLASARYSDYLVGQARSSQDRLAVKRKAIRLAKGLRPAPPIPKKALDLLGAAIKAVHARKAVQALVYCEAAQSLAPAWEEPYYSAGLIFEQLSYESRMQYAALAVQNLRLFLEAAAERDARKADVAQRIERIEELERGINASPTLPR